MQHMRTASCVAALLLGVAGIARSVEPDTVDVTPPGVLPTLPDQAPASAGRVHVSSGVAAAAPAPCPPLVTPSSTIFVATPDCTPACDTERWIPNLIGGIQAGSSLGLYPGGPMRVPLFARSAFTIADDESPRPQDRVYFGFNYYNDVRTPDTQIAINRETFGVEKTFLNGRASVGVRIPFVNTTGDFSLNSSDDIADMSVILKYAFLNDRPSGTALSGGLMITAPTGPAINTLAGDIHSTLLQPFLGGSLLLFDRAYLQGFSSVIVPTDSRDSVLVDNTIAVGYWAYRCDSGSCLRAIVPTFEVQVLDPLNHRDADSLIHYPDVVCLTAGVHVGLFKNSMLAIGASTPITGPSPFDVGAVAQYDLRF